MMSMGVSAVIGWSVGHYFIGMLERTTLQRWGMQSRSVYRSEGSIQPSPL